jgi:hypothetical protein
MQKLKKKTLLFSNKDDLCASVVMPGDIVVTLDALSATEHPVLASLSLT